MMATAAECQVIDVGVAALGVRRDMMDFTVIAGHVATRCAAATVLGVQHNSLRRGGQALGVVERQGLASIEYREVVVCVAGQPDHIRYGQDRTPAGEAAPAAASKSFSVVVTMMLAGNPLCWPRLPLVNKLRNPALSASWFRCGQLRVSRRACSFEGAPFTHGAFCSGLHIPGAASLAHTASIVARSSGSHIR